MWKVTSDTLLPHFDVRRTVMASHVLLLSDDLLLEVFRHVTCSRSLRRAARVCRSWRSATTRAATLFEHAWLAVDALTIVDAVMRAPMNERILIRSGTVLHGEMILPRPLHVKAEAGVVLRGQLLLRNNVEASQSGIVEGLDIAHFMESAVVVEGSPAWPRSQHQPLWELRACTISSSNRRRVRSSTAVRIAATGHLGLVNVTIDSAVHAVCLEGVPSQLNASGCTFSNTKEAIVTMGGGRVYVEASTFSGNSVAFKLDELVTGRAKANALEDGSMFGRWARPAGFRCHSNAYACPEANVDEEIIDEIACELCGVDTWMDGNWLLLCDGCDKAFHTRCLPRPHFTEVPDAEWFCPTCVESRVAHEVEVEMEMEAMDNETGMSGHGYAHSHAHMVDVDEVDGFVIEAQAIPV